MDKFLDIAINLKRFPVPVGADRILCFDPGETTGYAYFLCSPTSIELIHGELETHTVDKSVNFLDSFIEQYDPNLVVIEEYRVYAWKAKQHSWDTLHTARLIGCMECLCRLKGIDYKMQGARQGKEFCTDDKLKDWGMWVTGKRHARDAIRHGCSFILFNKHI